MAAIGDAWADGSYLEASWATGAWLVSVGVPVFDGPNIGTQNDTVDVAIAGRNFTARWSGTLTSWAATNLPTGLSIDGGTGIVSGTPTVVGASSVTITAYDGAAQTGNSAASNTFTWNINAASVGIDPTNLIQNLVPDLVEDLVR